jgi:ribosomal-protein-alanine N-acetyltransferase
VSLPPGFGIRTLELKDIDAVVEIEREAFTTPWQAETFAGLMEREGVELIVMTAPPDERVVGYAVLWCVLDQGELANIAIAPEERGAGLGTHLLRHVLDVGGRRGVHRVFLEVRASNRSALELYGRFGFEEVGRRANYYERPREDALVLRAELDVPSDHREGDAPQ